MSFKELLTNCYNTCCNIKITLELSKSITLKDIFTIIFLVTDKGCILVLDNTILDLIYTDRIEIDIDENHYPCIDISDTVTNPQIITMLYFISYQGRKYYPDIFYGNKKLEYENKGNFIDLANHMHIINYSKVIYIMSLFDISSTKQSSTVNYFIQRHLDII